MPYSYTTYTASNQTDFDYTSIALLDGVPVKDQLTVYVDGQLQTLGTQSPATNDYYIDLPNEQVVFHAAQNGTVKIARSTDIENKEVTFTNSSVLTAQDLNKNSDQLLFLCQELYDKAQDIAITSVGSIAPNAVTEEKLNKSTGAEAVTTSTIRNGAVIESKIGTNAVTETKIANDAVTEDKILDAAVTTDKINNLAVTTAKIADDAVNNDKMSAGAPTWDGSGNVTVTNDLTVTNNAMVDGNLSFDSGFGSTAVAYGCRAWAAVRTLTATTARVYTISGSNITVTYASHPFSQGDWVYLDISTGSAVAGFYEVTSVPTSSSFVVAGAVSGVTGGNCIPRLSVREWGGFSSIQSSTPTTATAWKFNFTVAMPDSQYAVVNGYSGADVSVTSTTTSDFVLTGAAGTTFAHVAVFR